MSETTGNCSNFTGRMPLWFAQYFALLLSFQELIANWRRIFVLVWICSILNSPKKGEPSAMIQMLLFPKAQVQPT